MERRKLTKEDIDKVRDIEGFPVGRDEDIIALSDAPYYTACPNPFIADFIREHGVPYDEATDNYHCEPFSADVSEGKNDPIYNAHAYHTKVPYKAIMRYILHYTKPGDIVFDGFCGSGMTGVAAGMCGSENGELRREFVSARGNWGARKAILSDLSPAATFIAYNYNNAVDVEALRAETKRALGETEKECGWVYETEHTGNGAGTFAFDSTKGRINFVVWSDVFICPHCGRELVFWDQAVDDAKGEIASRFSCPACKASLRKASCERAKDVVYDAALKKNVTFSKKVPALINYTYKGKRYTKKPDKADLDTIAKINSMVIPYWYPTDELPEGDKTKELKRANGIYYVHQLFTQRTLFVLSKFFSLVKDNSLRFIFTSALQNASKMYKFRTDGKGGILSGTLYVPALNQENNIFNLLSNKAEMIFKALSIRQGGGSIISTGSSTRVSAPDSCVDYIFTDPPFGANINYSELSFLWESWLKCITNTKPEAICNTTQNKGLPEYQRLMTDCFKEAFRILKPNHWMTVEFHNSQNAVWNAIQEAIHRAGFIISDVRTLDKKQGSFKQVTTSSAVKQDLVISCYKPRDSFRREFAEKAGSEETAWAFVRQHLANIPVVVVKGGEIELIAERQAYLLFDRMVAYHIMQGIPVPLDAADFYRGLDEKFLKRDNMYFLPDQVNEYDAARIKRDVQSIDNQLFVVDEKSAISWIYRELNSKSGGPKTYAELQPMFMQEVKAVERHEAMPELSEMLEENFLRDDEGRWYVPDRTKEGDLAKLREKNLWKEFESYMGAKGKLKQFRSEAVRAGFARLWKEKNYKAIVDVAERLPEQVVQEDANLLMYYDISLSRL